MGKKKNMDESTPLGENMNPFERLPNELIVRHILDKIPNSKSLFVFSLVSKRFASLIFDQVRPVTVRIPTAPSGPAPPSLSFLGRLFHFLGKPFWSLLRFPFGREPENHYDVVRVLKQTSLIKFLKKFSCIESLNIHLCFPGVGFPMTGFESLTKWKLDKSGFVYLSAKDLAYPACGGETVDDDDVNWSYGLAEAEILAHLCLINYHLADAFERIVSVEEIVKAFQDLKNVVVTVCLKVGMVSIDEELIAMQRNYENVLESPIKLWHLPVVKLPLSSTTSGSGGGGCVVKEATLCVVNLDGEIEDAAMAENAFQGKEFRELAMKMVEKEPCYEIMASLAQD